MSTNTKKPESVASSSLIGGQHSYDSVNKKISSIILTRGTTLGWLAGFALSFGLVMLLLYSLAVLVVHGVGIWGINVPVSWGFAINCQNISRSIFGICVGTVSDRTCCFL